MNQFRKKGMRHILMFSPLSKQALPHMQPAQASNKLSLSPSLSLPTCPDPDKNISL